MEIYVVRHGIAEERREGLADADRELTAEGRAKTRKAFRGLARLGVELDRVLASPLARAWATARLLSKELDAPKPLLEAALAPGSDPGALLARLANEPAGSRVALVGHEPDLGALVGLLAFGLGGPAFELDKAGVARLVGTPALAGARLDWFVSSKVLRRAARG